MVRKGAAARRSLRDGSQISALKRLSLLDPAAPEPPVLRIDPDESPGRPDQVYLQAAAIFQSTHLEKPAAHRLISYGSGSEVSGSEVSRPAAWGDTEQRFAYQLAFNTLKYQELLEDVLIDSSFCVSQPVPAGGMSLVAVMLTDLLDRKFLPRLQLANQEEEVQAVREVEACLLRFRTKLVASLARCRIKHDLLTLDNILPEKIRHRQERATQLPLYGWINTLLCSFEEVSEVLHTSGFSCVKSVGQLEGWSFCKDTHCQDLLVFPNSRKRELSDTGLLRDCRLVIQDKSCCVGPWALRPLLAEGGDVLMTGCFSALTVAHVSAVAASASAHTHAETHTHSQRKSSVIVCLGDEPKSHREELKNTLSKMGCKNVKLLPVSLESVDVCDVRLLEVRVMVVIPACSLSAVSNPVDYIMQENRDPRLMLDLSHGSVSPEKLQTLVCRQRKDLQRAVQFPQVRAVLYSTCSVHSEENEEVLKTILSQENHCTAPPYSLSSPVLLQDSVTEDEDESQEMKASFFRLEASDHHNGCFLALLVRQPEPEVLETPKEVLARAAAKGLLDGIQPIRKEGRGRRSRRAAVNQTRPVKTNPHATQSHQSRVAEYLANEMKGSSSAPSVWQQNGSRTPSPRSPLHYEKPTRSRRLFQGVFSRTSSTPKRTDSTLNTTSSTSNTTDSTPKPTDTTHNTRDSIPNHTGSTPNTRDSTPNLIGSTSNNRDSTPYLTGSTSNTRDTTPNLTGSTSNTRDSTPYLTGSTSNTRDSTPNPTGFIFIPTDSTPNLTGSTSNNRDSTPNLTGPISNTRDSTPNLTGSTSNTRDSTPNPTGFIFIPTDSTPNTIGSTPNTRDFTPNPTDYTLNTTGSTHYPTGHTSNTRDYTFIPSDSTPHITSSSFYTTASTPNPTDYTLNTTGSTHYPTGHTPNPTGYTFIPTGSTHYPTGQTSNTRDYTFIPSNSTPNTRNSNSNTTGSLHYCTSSTPNTRGSTHYPTDSTPNTTHFSGSYCNSVAGLNAAAVSVNNSHSSPPVAPPKGRQEVLRPSTVTFPSVLLSNEGRLPQRRSHAPINSAHTHQQWSNSTPALPRAQSAFRARRNHLRPWL